MKLKEHLHNKAACPNAIKWTANKGIETAWYTCPYGTWLNWVIHILCLPTTKESGLMYTRSSRALNIKGSGMSPAGRIRNAIPSSTIERAYKYTTHYKQCEGIV